MSATISKQGQRELLDVLRPRYRRAARHDKSKILDEFVAVAGCHRKHAIRLLTADPPVLNDPAKPSRRLYDEAVREALIVLWEAASWVPRGPGNGGNADRRRCQRQRLKS